MCVNKEPLQYVANQNIHVARQNYWHILWSDMSHDIILMLATYHFFLGQVDA